MFKKGVSPMMNHNADRLFWVIAPITMCMLISTITFTVFPRIARSVNGTPLQSTQHIANDNTDLALKNVKMQTDTLNK